MGPRISKYDEFEKVKVERLRGNGAGNPVLLTVQTVALLNQQVTELYPNRIPTGLGKTSNS